MARRKHLWTHMYRTSVTIFHLAVLTSSTNVTTPTPTERSTEGAVGYAWSAWGAWSPCSKSCGGGISVQERKCLPRSRLPIPDGTLPTPIITVRVSRDVQEECAGLAKRYYECNTKPCYNTERDSRAAQCAAYDRSPFRGRFYTWVPYVDGNNPCTLNCRPLGQHFYASLSLAADGTPCSKPGSRAVCIQGVCKAVGHGGVMSAVSTRELRCGRRLVAGLFSRPRLPLGYSYVTTVPRGACRLNVTELLPSENYIALKISNNSYIMNGEFAVSTPGVYDAAGTRFIYSRTGGLDSVFALGPILYPIDIMVLYTQPKPSIKYQYFTESLPGEVDLETVTKPNIPEVFSTAQAKHIRRHHSYDSFEKSGGYTPRYPDIIVTKGNTPTEDDFEENVVGDRRFVWKILSYTQCSRSCGGGIQVGKYRCVESNANGFDKEVSSVHCIGSGPVGRRRRCGNMPCSPRWRTAAWTTCPKCGPASRTRIVGCVQDHSRGITKVSNSKCLTPKPPTTEKCNIPDCDDLNTGEVKYIEKKNMFVNRENTDNFHDGPVYSVPINNTSADVELENSFSAVAGWIFTEWSDCVGWCVGSGIQTRQVRCTDPSGCVPRKAPESTRSCTPTVECNPHDGHWFTGEWSSCSSTCDGKQIRGVICIGADGRHLKDVACKLPKPEQEKSCGKNCQSTWFFSDWSQCIGNCSFGSGIQRRTVWCTQKDGAGKEDECLTQRPLSSRSCEPQCKNVEISTLPPGLTIESQKVSKVDITTFRTTTTTFKSKDCEDKLNNCVLAVQARLCHYNYYIQNCCYSCNGR